MKQINGYQDRVCQECNELKIKYDRLDAFITGVVFNTLPDKERCRLREQRHYMSQYLKVLSARIEWFNSDA